MKKLALLLSFLALGALGLTACGGGDDEATGDTNAATGDTNAAILSPKQEAKQEIERIGAKWAPLFAAAEPTACSLYMIEEACSRIDCEHFDGRPMKNCTPPSPGLRKSFADATVHDIALRRFKSGAMGFKAGAKFSNRETVLFHLDGGGWKIVKVGGNPGPGWRWLGDRVG
jgi:hypothetical protein